MEEMIRMMAAAAGVAETINRILNTIEENIHLRQQIAELQAQNQALAEENETLKKGRRLLSR